MTGTMGGADAAPGTDEEIRDRLAWLARSWQSGSGSHPPLPVSAAYGAERVRRLLPATVPVAVADPAADDLVELLRQARNVSTWIRFSRYDRLCRFLTGARDGDRPRGLYAWLTRYRDKSYLSTTLPLIGVIAAIAGALLQGYDGYGPVWGAGLVAAVIAVVLLVEPAVTAWYAYGRIRRLWRRLEDGSLAHAARRWSQEVVRESGVLDDRYGRLLAAAYFTDIADAWDRRPTAPMNWFRAWREDYPVLIAGFGAVRPVRALGALLEAYHKVPRRGAVLVLPAGVPLPEPVRALGDGRSRPPRTNGLLVDWPSFLYERRWRRAVGGALVAVIMAGAVAIGSAGYAMMTDQCWGMAGDVDTVGENEERIGFQTCGEPFWRAEGWGGRASTGAEDGTWEDQIYQENRQLPRLAARNGREVHTVLLVTSLTRRDANGSVVPETEGLAGAYTAQKEINHNTQVPLVQLAIVNTGDKGLLIKEALDLVESFVASPENRVVGAVVTVNSTSISQKQLRRLDRAGLVLVSPTMTADGFGGQMRRFFQMISPNGQQAEMIVRYAIGQARKAGRRSAAFFHAAPPDRAGIGTDRPFEDLYVKSLRQKVGEHRRELAAVGMRLVDVTWRDPGDDLSAACARPGRYTVVYYGGRYTEFPAFVEDLRGHCDTAGMPTVIANDSVSRFLMDPALAGDVRFGISVTIASRGPLLSCAHYNGRQGAMVPRRRDFVTAIGSYLGRCGASPGGTTDSFRLAGGWAAGSYDALSLLHAAAQRDRGGRLDPTAKALAGLRARVADALASNEMKGMGVVSPVRFTNRVASRGVWLYCVPELRTAFSDGRSPADGSAVPVTMEGDNYERRVGDVLVGARPTGCRPPRAP